MYICALKLGSVLWDDDVRSTKSSDRLLLLVVVWSVVRSTPWSAIRSRPGAADRSPVQAGCCVPRSYDPYLHIY